MSTRSNPIYLKFIVTLKAVALVNVRPGAPAHKHNEAQDEEREADIQEELWVVLDLVGNLLDFRLLLFLTLADIKENMKNEAWKYWVEDTI